MESRADVRVTHLTLGLLRRDTGPCQKSARRSTKRMAVDSPVELVVFGDACLLQVGGECTRRGRRLEDMVHRACTCRAHLAKGCRDFGAECNPVVPPCLALVRSDQDGVVGQVNIVPRPDWPSPSCVDRSARPRGRTSLSDTDDVMRRFSSSSVNALLLTRLSRVSSTFGMYWHGLVASRSVRTFQFRNAMMAARTALMVRGPIMRTSLLCSVVAARSCLTGTFRSARR